jgi:hypothetical protein
LVVLAGSRLAGVYYLLVKLEWEAFLLFAPVTLLAPLICADFYLEDGLTGSLA